MELCRYKAAAADVRRLLRKKGILQQRYSSLYVCIFYTKIANLVRLAQGVVDCARGGSPMQNLLLFWLRITLHFSSAADCLHSLPLQQCERRRRRWRRRTLHNLAAAARRRCASAVMAGQGWHREGGYVVGACSCFRGCAISLQRSWTTVNNFWCIIIIIIVKKVQLVLPKLQVWDQSKIFNGKLQMYFCNAAAAAVHKCRSSSQ